MKNHIKKPIKPTRLKGLPLTVRQTLKAARQEHGWSQAELGERAGLPQMHVSGIETGKIVPRFDTLLDLARVLGHDLVLAPRALVPAIQALLRHGDRGDDSPPLYALQEEGDSFEPAPPRDEV